jgi:hypothetical protein
MTLRQLLEDAVEETKKAVHASKTIIRLVFVAVILLHNQEIM